MSYKDLVIKASNQIAPAAHTATWGVLLYSPLHLIIDLLRTPVMSLDSLDQEMKLVLSKVCVNKDIKSGFSL